MGDETDVENNQASAEAAAPKKGLSLDGIMGAISSLSAAAGTLGGAFQNITGVLKNHGKSGSAQDGVGGFLRTLGALGGSFGSLVPMLGQLKNLIPGLGQDGDAPDMATPPINGSEAGKLGRNAQNQEQASSAPEFDIGNLVANVQKAMGQALETGGRGA